VSAVPSPVALRPALIERLSASVGREHALVDVDQQLPYLRQWRELYHGRAGVVLRPATTEQVSRLLAIAHAEAIPVVP
jgi:FAD/FMN-containing dehydrogenase